MLCSKLHCQKGFNLNPFSYKIALPCSASPASQRGAWQLAVLRNLPQPETRNVTLNAAHRCSRTEM